MQAVSLCPLCKHLHEGLPRRCAAYPDRIPPAFAFGWEAHFDPAEGDHGIQFEEAPGLPPAARGVVELFRKVHQHRQQEAGAADKEKGVRPTG